MIDSTIYKGISRTVLLSLALIAEALLPFSQKLCADYAISDASAEAGELITLFITADEQLPPGTAVDISMSYPNRALAFEGVSNDETQNLGGTQTAQTIDGMSNILTVSGLVSEIDTETDNLIALVFRSLVGGGESAEVEVRSLAVGGVPVPQEEIDPLGNVSIKGGGIIELRAQTGVSPPYPNPFTASTRIKFSLAKESRVTFSLFSLSGRKMDQIPNDNLPFGEEGFFRYGLFGDVPESGWDGNTALEKGNYTLELFPKAAGASAGQYFLVLETEEEKLSVTLIYFK